MSFPGPNQPPSNGGGNKPNGGNNPFTNPFSRNNDGKNGGSGANGNKSNGPRPFWQSPWLWVVVVALLAVTMFQLFAGAGSQTIDTKDGMQILNGNTVEYATIVDNTQQVKLKLSSDYSATDPDTGRTKNYGKNVQFYYTYAQSAAVVKAVQKADPAKGWTASMQQTSIWTYLLTSLLPFLIIFGLFWFLMSRMGGAAGGMFGMARPRPPSSPTWPAKTLPCRRSRKSRTSSRTRPVTRLWAPAFRAACCCTALQAPVRRCWRAPSQARPACRSTPWPAPTSWRCSWALAPPVCVTCSMRPRRTLRPSSSSMRLTLSAASVAVPA